MIDNALGIPGWMEENELFFLAEQAAKSKVIAEIGCWQGRSTRALADSTKGIVFAIDTWDDGAQGIKGWWPNTDQTKAGWLMDAFEGNLKCYLNTKVFPIRMSSLDAAKLLRLKEITFDMIFIDASHDYESVKADILAWKPLLREGGVLCGHDFGHPMYEVEPAVRELIPDFDLPAGMIWRAL